MHPTKKHRRQSLPSQLRRGRQRAFRNLLIERFEARELLAVTPLQIHVYDGTSSEITTADAKRGSSETALPSNPLGDNWKAPYNTNNTTTIASLGSNGTGQFHTANFSIGDRPVPAPGSGDSYAVFLVGKIQIDNTNNPGNQWTFGLFADDDARIRIDLDQDGILEGSIANGVGQPGTNGETVVAKTNGCCQVSLGTPITIADGIYDIEMVYTEGGGGDYGEFFYAPGAPAFNTTNYALIGDDRLGISLDLNQKPVINNLDGDIGNGGALYFPNTAPVLLDAGALATVTDPNNPANFVGGTLRIKTLNGAEGQDVIAPQNNGAGSVLVGATIVGTYTGGTGGTDLLITFNANATAGNVNHVLQNVRFSHTSATPANASRLFEWTFNDGDGLGKTSTVRTALNINLGDGTESVHVWDGNSDFDGGDGVNWNNPLNWDSNSVPDADDIARFTGLAPANVSLGGTRVVGGVEFSSGTYTLSGGTLQTYALTQNGGTNVIDAQLQSSALAATISSGQLSVRNFANGATLLGGTWAVAAGAKLVGASNGTASALGHASVELDGGSLEFSPDAAVTVSALKESWFPNVFADTNLIIDANPANNTDTYLALLPDSVTSLTTALGPFATAALVARSPSNLGAFGNRFGASWTGQLTVGGALPAGPISLGTSSDDGSAIYVDVNNNHIFESTELIVDNRGGHGNQQRIGTVNLPVAGTYDVYIGYYEGSGGGTMEARYAAGSAVAYASQTIINPGAQAGVWSIQVVPTGNAATNDVHVLADSTIIVGATLPGVSLGRLTMNSGTTLLVDSPDIKQNLSFDSVVLNGNATFDSTGKPNITLRNISESAASALNFSGDGVYELPTGNSYSGTTTINSGVSVVIGNPSSLGSTAGNTIVNSGAALAINGGVTTGENISIAGTGNSKFDAPLYKNGGGNVVVTGQIDVVSNARIHSQGGNEMFLDGGIAIDPGVTLTLEVDNRINVRNVGISGAASTSIVVGDGREVLDLEVNSPSFSGNFVLNQGRIEGHVPQAFGNSTGSTTVNGNDASVWVRNGHTYAENFFIEGDGRDTEGAIRSEGGNNTISGVVTLTGHADIYVNNSNLTLTQGLQGAGFVLNKTGTNINSRLNLQQDSNIKALRLSFGQVRIHTENGLGGTQELLIGSGNALEFSGNLAFDATDTLGRLIVNNGTLGSYSGTTTLDIPITLGAQSNLTFDGDGDLDILQGFGNGTGTAPLDALSHFGYHINSDALALNLNNNGGVIGSGDPATFQNFEGHGLLTTGPGNRGLDFDNDNDFRAVLASIQDDASGDGRVIDQNDQYSNLFWGTLSVSPQNAGIWTFDFQADDDIVGFWIDTNRNGIFESDGTLNDNRGEQITWDDGNARTVNLAAGEYMVAFTHREGGGGSQIDMQFTNPGIHTSLTKVRPADPSQADLWRALDSVVPGAAPVYTYVEVAANNSVVKNGTGTVTLAGNNTYNGTTTINAGAIVAANNNAFGSSSNDITLGTNASVGFTNDITITGKNLVGADGKASGQPATIFNVSGNNSFLGNITAAPIPLVQELSLTSLAGSLTIGQVGVHTFDAQFSQVVLDGAGDIILNSAITSQATPQALPAWKAHLFNANTTRLPGDVNQLAAQLGTGEAYFVNESAGVKNWVTFWGESILGLNNTGNPVDPNNYGNTIVADLNVAGVGTVDIKLRTTSADDANRIRIDLNGNGVFEGGSEDPYGSDRGGTFTTGTITINRGTPYAIALQHREGGGGSRLQPEISLDNGTTWARFDTAGISSGGNTATWTTLFTPALELVKHGTGTVTLAGNNSSYAASYAITEGTLVAAHNNALGQNTAGTTVQDGATLGLAGGVTISGEALTINGLGAAGQPGAIANISSNNTIDASSSITAEVVSLGEIGIGSTVDTLTVNASVDLKSSKLVVNGTGATTINGSISGTGMDVGANPPENAGAVTGVFNNVPEASNYILTYELTPVNNVIGANPFPYTRDNTATVQPFDRIAYYLELDSGAGLEYVYVSMDAFTNNLSQIGIPNGGSLFKWQQLVSNMNVFSNKAGIVTGTGITTGNIEIWPSNYGGQNDLGIPNASGGSTYDFGDGGSNTGLGYGAFQVHNYGASQVLLAYNNWRSGSGDLGIGNRPTSHIDYTFANNLPSYSLRRMAILVRETTPRLIQANNSLLKTGTGTLTLGGANTYNGGTTVSQGTIQSATPASTQGTITLGDANTGANNVAWLFAGSTTPTNPIVVTSQGTGTATIGTYSAGSFTTHNGPITLNRPTTFSDATGDRTSFLGQISGNVGLITIAGTRITFDNAANNFVGDLLIPAGRIYQNNANGALPDSTNVTANGTFQLNNSPETINALNGTGTVRNIVGGNTLTIGANNGSGTFAGAFTNNSGTFSLIKNGTGVQYLDGASTYTGMTTVNAGYLVVRNNQALGSSAGGTVVNNPGTLQLESLAGVNVNVANEPLAISGFGVGGTRGALANWSGVNSFSGPITIAGNSSIFVNSGSLNLSGAISGAAGLSNRKTGGGDLIYSGSVSNTFAGTTILDIGNLYLGKTGGAVAIAGPMQMGGGNTSQPNLRMQQSNQFGPGVVMSFANTNGNWARFDLAATSQSLAGLNAGTATTQAGAVIQNVGLDGVGTGTGTLTLNGSGTYLYHGYLRDQDNGGTTNKLSLVKSGTGVQTLSGVNVNYTGPSSITGGTLQLVDTRNFRSSLAINAPGVLEINSSTPFATRWNYAQTISGNGTINKTGTGVFGITGVNNFAGQINIQQGTVHNDGLTGDWSGSTANVQLSAGATLDLRGNNITVAALQGDGSIINSYYRVNSGIQGETLTVGANNASSTFNGVISGSSTANATANGRISLTKIGSGTQLLNGVNTFTGPTIVAAGTLGGDGSLAGPLTVSGNATLSPGTIIGDFASGNLTLESGSIFSAQLNGPLPDSGYDQQIVTGTVTINGGTLSVAPNFVSAPGQIFALIVNDGNDPTNGAFVGLPEGSSFIVGGQQFFISYNDPLNRFATGNDVALIRNRDLVANDDTFGPILRNTSISDNVKSNDIDPDFDGVMGIVTPAAHGTVTITDPATGDFTYTPNANFIGTDTFEYRLYDGEFESTALVTITVAPTVVQDDVFYVAGTTGADRILIQPASGGRINVRYNNALFGPFSDAQRVVVIGFAGNDNITVSGSLPYPVAFYGGDGNDYLSGGSRADILDGGEGADRLFGNGGNDELYGGPGNDTLSGGAGDDLLDGDSTTDLIADVTSQDLASLIGAVDLPDASLHGRDNLSGVAGNDILYGQGGGDVLNGGAGNDQMYAGEGSDKLDGGSGNDLLAGEAGADKLYGRAGRDTLVGGDDLDTIYGGTGMDLIYGGDVDLATLFTIWENWSTGVSADANQAFTDLDDFANDDGLVDLLHGEGDIDWYLNYSDRFLLSSEARLPNRIENR